MAPHALACASRVLTSAVVLGAGSVAEREQPSVTLSAAMTEGITTVTVKARGSGLRSEADMFVQLVRIDTLSKTKAAAPIRDQCGRSFFRMVPERKSRGARRGFQSKVGSSVPSGPLCV